MVSAGQHNKSTLVHSGEEWTKIHQANQRSHYVQQFASCWNNPAICRGYRDSRTTHPYSDPHPDPDPDPDPSTTSKHSLPCVTTFSVQVSSSPLLNAAQPCFPFLSHRMVCWNCLRPTESPSCFPDFLPHQVQQRLKLQPF